MAKFIKKPREKREFEQKIVDLARITRVTKGGKRLRFRACVAVGDMKGKVGIGIAKGADVSLAVNKAAKRGQQKMITVRLVNDTIPHQIRIKRGAVKLLLKPAPRGTGVKAGGAVRVVLELAGVPNIVGKILGTQNKINNCKVLLEALDSFIEKSRKNAPAALKKEANKPVKEK